MKSMERLACAMLNDIGRLYHVDTTRDEHTLRARIQREGESFLTITLPSFEADLLYALKKGRISPKLFAGFGRSSGLPRFLRGFLAKMFSDGTVRSDIDPALLKAVRQFLLTFKKVERECTPKRVYKALKGYHDTDSSLPVLSEEQVEALTNASILLFGEFFCVLEASLFNEGVRPYHSTGALATRESFNGRYSSVRWSEKIQKVFPDWDTFYLNPHHMLDVETELDQEGCEPPARVLTVPKTLKTPRIIAMEPVYNQFVQQGIFRKMTEILATPRFAYLWKVMCWDTQEFNREFARRGSQEENFCATLDMSEASDRVSLQHIEAILAPYPFLLEAVLCCRSEVAVTPLGVQHLRKFASMGSSLCFPFESIVFTILSWIGMGGANRSAHPRDGRNRPFPWRVYGDDIIVPQTQAYEVMDVLQSFGLKVNYNKSFWTGKFRESCGGDYYNGVDVSVHKLKVDIDPRTLAPGDLESLIHFRNFLYEEFVYVESVRVLDEIILRQRYVPRTGSRPLAGVSLLSDEGAVCRFDEQLHRWVYKVLRFRSVTPSDPLDGWGALRKFFDGDGENLTDKNHLNKGGRSRCVGTYIGWSPLV